MVLTSKHRDCMIIEDSLSGLDFAYRCHPGRLIAITSPERKKAYESMAGVDAVIHDFRSFDTSFFLK